MKERKEILKNISLKEILNWISKEENQSKKKAFQLLLAEKLLLNHSNWNEVLKCVRNEDVKFDGFMPYSTQTHNLYETKTELLTRAYAEYDTEHKQLVVNAYLHTIKDGVHLFGFLDRPKKKMVDQKSSLSGSTGMIGGHVSYNDHSFYACLVREISEEFKKFRLDGIVNIEPRGYINDSSTDISTYHLCVLYEIFSVYSVYMKNIIPVVEEGKVVWFTKDQIQKELDKGVLDSRFDSWAYIAMSNRIKELR